jgi:glycosyltransferase involved in cell wall biosynthesis
MLIEAFACGVPVVASDSGEIPYVVANAGVIVNERDENAWVAALNELLDSPALRVDLAGRGVEQARTRFAWECVAREHLDFFSALLDQR